MDRTSQILGRLQRLIPGGASRSGWNLQRQMVAAKALDTLANQAELAERQLRLGSRVDASSPAMPVRPNGAGAAGPYLDTWGSTMGVPREAREPDAAYSRRIILEFVRRASNNVGMAALFDDVLATSGTVVEDSATWLRASYFGPADRFNADARFLGFQDTAAELHATFCVLLPAEDTGHLTREAAAKIVARRKVAGTELLLLATKRPSVPTQPPPDLSIAPGVFGMPGARFNEARAFSPPTPSTAPVRFGQTGAAFNSGLFSMGRA